MIKNNFMDKKIIKWILNLFFIACLIPTVCFCSETDDLNDQTATTVNVVEQKDTTLEEKFIQNNIIISRWFDEITEAVDLFLVGEKLTKEKNPSYIRLENTTETKERENLTNSFDLSVNVRLQNLEQYFQFKLMSQDEENSQKSSVKNNYSTQRRTQKYSAAIGFFKNLGKIKTTFQPKLELTDPLAISHSLRFESVASYNSFQINPKLELFANATKGVGTVEAINFHFPINQKYAITQINEYEYFEKTHEFTGTNGISLSQFLNSKSSLNYYWIFDSINQPSYHLKSYDIGITYYRIIYKKMLDIRLTPHVTFPKSDQFKGQWGAVFTLAINF